MSILVAKRKRIRVARYEICAGPLFASVAYQESRLIVQFYCVRGVAFPAPDQIRNIGKNSIAVPADCARQLAQNILEPQTVTSVLQCNIEINKPLTEAIILGDVPRATQLNTMRQAR